MYNINIDGNPFEGSAKMRLENGKDYSRCRRVLQGLLCALGLGKPTNYIFLTILEVSRCTEAIFLRFAIVEYATKHDCLL